MAALAGFGLVWTQLGTGGPDPGATEWAGVIADATASDSGEWNAPAPSLHEALDRFAAGEEREAIEAIERWSEGSEGLSADSCLTGVGVRRSFDLGQLALGHAQSTDDPSFAATVRLGSGMLRRGTVGHFVVGTALLRSARDRASALGSDAEAFEAPPQTLAYSMIARDHVCAVQRLERGVEPRDTTLTPDLLRVAGSHARATLRAHAGDATALAVALLHDSVDRRPAGTPSRIFAAAVADFLELAPA